MCALLIRWGHSDPLKYSPRKIAIWYGAGLQSEIDVRLNHLHDLRAAQAIDEDFNGYYKHLRAYKRG